MRSSFHILLRNQLRVLTGSLGLEPSSPDCQCEIIYNKLILLLSQGLGCAWGWHLEKFIWAAFSLLKSREMVLGTGPVFNQCLLIDLCLGVTPPSPSVGRRGIPCKSWVYPSLLLPSRFPLLLGCQKGGCRMTSPPSPARVTPCSLSFPQG